MKKEIIIIGAGGHAKSCIDIINYDQSYSIKGIIGLENDLNLNILGHNVIGEEKDLKEIFITCKNVLIAIGQIKTPKKRVYLYEFLLDIGFKLPTIISPRSYISSNSKIGQGSIIMHGAIVNAGASIGDNCIINTNAIIEHDAIIQNHCHISTGSIINGASTVGEGTFIGSGTIVNNNINIGKESLIGSSKNIYKDLEEFTKIIK